MFRRLILHPFLLSIYVILSLVIHNLGAIPPAGACRSLAILLFLTGLLLLVVRSNVKDWHRAGFLVFILLAFLFVYGHLYRVLADQLPAASPAFQRLALLLLWTALAAALASGRFWRRVRHPQMATLFLNLVMVFVLAVPVVLLALFFLQRSYDPLAHWKRPPGLAAEPGAPVKNNRPDIYYIVVDGYSRADVLAESYGFNNRAFLDYLARRGFYIGEHSSSNYIQTALSLASSLNLAYLDELSAQGEGSSNREPLKELIRDSRVRRYLEAAGYRMVSVNSGYSYTQVQDADIYLTSLAGLNDFEELLLSSTPLLVLADYAELHLPLQGYGVQRERLEYSFDVIKEIPALPGPKFVFVHLVAPHPPFVFDATGKPVEPDYPYSIDDANLYPGTENEYRSGYAGQLQYVNDRLETAIAAILDNSQQDPVIVLQGDHGSRFGVNWDAAEAGRVQTAMAILNAYHLPAGGANGLYPSISPVNSFRYIFDHYFGAQLGLLEDRSYFSNFARPYLFQTVSELREIGGKQP